jgi:hypothetical protein
MLHALWLPEITIRQRHAMRIWIDGVPRAFEDVFKMAAEEIRESEHPG